MKDKRSLFAPLLPLRLALAISFTQGALLKQLLPAGLLLMALAATSAPRAQTCDNIPIHGDESISAQITSNGTGIPVTDGMVVPA